MLILSFLVINFAIFFSWFLFLLHLKKESLATTGVYVGFLGGGQIVLTELILGFLGILYLPYLLVFNVLVCLGLMGGVYRIGRGSFFLPLRAVYAQVKEATRKIFGWENILLFGLFVFLCIWILIAAFFLPPRGIDDIVYHLPPLYQYVQTHQIELLPVALRGSFAFPLNGDFLFLWPLIFFHEDTFIDLVQFFAAIYGVLVLYALARVFGISQKDSFFISFLFLFIPVVLGQAGSNYNDVITGVTLLALLFSAVRFYRSGKFFHLSMAGLITGLGFGIKYSFLLFSLAVQPIIGLRFWKDRRIGQAIKRYGVYLFLAFPLGSIWYIRNFMETGNPFYPLWSSRFSSGDFLSPIRALQPGRSSSSAFRVIFESPDNFFSFLFYDLGLGSFHGGFGVIFFGLGIPALVFCIVQGVRKVFKKDFFPILFWLQFLFAYYSIILLSVKDFQFNQRYVLYVVGFGLIAIGVLFKKFREELPFSVPILKLFCVGASFLAVIHMASYGWPSYQIRGAVADWISGRQTSEYKYLRQSPWDLPSLSLAWEPLDYLTRDGEEGWSVYTAATHGVFWVTPAFGSHLQNRIWNFEKNPGQDPDAFIFHYDRRSMDLFYLGRKITPEEVQKDGNYSLVTQTSYTQFWVKKTLLEKPGVSERLKSYYEKTFEGWIRSAEQLKHLLAEDGVVVTSSPLGYGFKYLFLKGDLRTPVYLVPNQREETFASGRSFAKVYTVKRPLNGFESRPLAELAGPPGNIYLYENIKVP